ncbi:MAG: glycosyltransferase family 4 protein [Patescibacteria group bacterium]
MRFLYLNTRNVYPQDKHLIDGLRELGHTVKEVSGTKSLRENCDAVIVGFTSPILAIKARLASPKKIIFNAVMSQYEANVISRRKYGLFGIRAAKWWFVDFASFYLSSIVLLESRAQVEFISRFFFVPREKLVRSFSGINEKEFFFDQNIKKKEKFTVLFRGRFLPESGILTVIETAKKLEKSDIEFLVIGHGFMYREVNALMAKLHPKNLTMMNEKLPIETLRNLMLQSHISLGQFARHPRLERTLPCKLFESLALGLPYLTGRNEAVFEILEENKTCLVVNQADPDSLARKILELKNDREALGRIGKAGHDLYRQKLTSKKLAEDFMNICFK